MKKLKWLFYLSFKLSGLIRPITLSSSLSVLSLTIGVATLLVSMALVDSYENNFKDSIRSVFSHAVLYNIQGDKNFNIKKVTTDLKKVYPEEILFSPSSKKEALLAHKGKVLGVILDGVDLKTVDQVIDLKNKVIKGQYKLGDSQGDGSTSALLGKDLAENFNLEPGDNFTVVVPTVSYSGTSGFSRKLSNFTVGGLVDLGSHEYNKRFIFAENQKVNEAASRPLDYYSEMRVKINDDTEVDLLKSLVIKNFSDSYWMQTWKDKSGGLLEAIKVERVVIFFIVLILVVVAAFNVSTNLFLNLAKRLKDFSVLQTVGFSKKDIFKILVVNGILLSLFGIVFGGVLSLIILELLNWILQSGYFVPPEVYKLTHIELSLNFSKFLIVSMATIILCFLAAIAPASNIAKLSITKGLRYE